MARQTIKYESTTVDAGKSAAEIAQITQNYGCSRFEMMWDQTGLLTGIRFALRHPKLGEIPVRLMARTEKIEKILANKIWNVQDRKMKAYRIAWRQLKDFVEQQLLAVQTGLFPVHEVFMAQVETVDPQTGETVTIGELVDRHGALAPGGGLRLLPKPRVIDADFKVEAG